MCFSQPFPLSISIFIENRAKHINCCKSENIICIYCGLIVFQTLRDLDEEFRDNHIDIITRFYELFESIHSYINDLNQFLEDIEEGIHIHQSLETIFADIEGKQLLVRSKLIYFRSFNGNNDLML